MSDQHKQYLEELKKAREAEQILRALRLRK